MRHVTVNIRSSFRAEERDAEEQICEAVCPGVLRPAAEGGTVLCYTDRSEEGVAQVRLVLTPDRRTVEMHRSGGSGAHLRFAEGQRHYSVYTAPHGSFSLSVLTERLHVSEAERELRLELRYRMELGGVAQSVCLVLSAVPAEAPAAREEKP